MPIFSANLSLQFREAEFLDRFGRAAAAGFHSVEYMFPYAYEAQELRARLEDAGLSQDLFNLPAGDFEAGERGIANDPRRVDEFRSGVRQALQYAEILEVPKLNCLVGLEVPQISAEEQYACVVANMEYAAEHIGRAGRVLLVELVNQRDAPEYFIRDLATVRRLLADVSAAHFRFLLDVYHLQRTQGEILTSVAELGPLIGHVQVADPPSRHEPGTGELNFRNVFRAIDDVGYTGRIGLEYIPSRDTEGSLTWASEYGYSLA